MKTETIDYEALKDPDGLGVEIIRDFADADEISGVCQEADNPKKVSWLDAHDVYTNKRGLTIVQNHFAFALKLSAGDQSPLEQLPAAVALKERTERFVRSLATLFPSLASWAADELSLHLYDDREVGLSRHRDNLRFVGLVVIIALAGESDLVITRQSEDVTLAVGPGDLCLLRAPGLIDCQEEVRPEHSVRNLKTKTRLSMMLRANDRPTEAIPGFKFNNWNPKEANQTNDA